MAQNKTIATKLSVDAYIDAIDNAERKADCKTLLDLMSEITGEPAVMWGHSIIGFGSYHYKYESGREGDFLLTGFSNRKQNITIYIISGFSHYEKLLSSVGPHKTGKSCFYIKRLSDINLEVLQELIKSSIEVIKKRYS